MLEMLNMFTLRNLKLQLYKNLKDLINEFDVFFFFGINVDGGSVNTVICRGLGLKLKKGTPLLVFSLCFNHRLELKTQIQNFATA